MFSSIDVKVSHYLTVKMMIFSAIWQQITADFSLYGLTSAVVYHQFIFSCCLLCLLLVYLWLLFTLFIISLSLAAVYYSSSVTLWLLSIVYHQFIFGCSLYCLLSVYLWLLFKLFIIGLSSAASSCIIQVIFKELTMFINNWSEGGVIVPGHLDHLYPRLWGFCILLEWGSEPVFNGSFQGSEELLLDIVCCIPPIPHLPENNSNTVYVCFMVVVLRLKL